MATPEGSYAFGDGGSGSSRPYRPYYTPREDAFVVSAPRFSSATASGNASGSGSPSSAGPASVGPKPSGGASSGGAGAASGARRPVGAQAPATRNRYFDASGDDDLLEAAAAGLSGSGASPAPFSTASNAATLTQAAKAMLVAGGLQYASTLLAMPFEVGKLLLQIQWAPREDVWLKHSIRAGARAAAAAAAAAERPPHAKHFPPSPARQGAGAAGRPTPLRRLSTSRTDENDESDKVWGDELRSKRRKVSEEAAAAAGASSSAGLPQDGSFENDYEEEEDELAAAAELLPEAEGDWGDLGAKDFGGEEEELSDEEDAEKYFNDLSSRAQRPGAASSAAGAGAARRKPTDKAGYVLRRSMLDEGTRPEFVMPVVFTGGVWEMIKAVARGREGWLGLWKGSFTTFVLDLVAGTIQPALNSFLAVFVPGSKSRLPLPYSPKPWRTLSVLFGSHLLTGLLVSPLDLVRTRLVAQSTLPRHRKYRGPYDALSQILAEEGGWVATYLHPHLLVPAILDCTFRPFISLATPLLIDHFLRLDANSSPVLYALWELIISTLSLGITLPIETVRRRLQVQARADWGQKPQTRFGSSLVVKMGLDGTETPGSGSAGRSAALLGSGSRIGMRGLRTCVETRPEPYAGFVDTLYKIVTEETTVSPKAKVKARLGLGSDAPHGHGHAREDSTASTATGVGAGAPGAAGALGRSQVLAPSGHSSLGGLGSLYRGFSMGFSANLLVFLLTVVSGERSSGTGWAEI